MHSDPQPDALSRLALKILRDVDASERLYRRNASSGYTFAGRGVLKLVREGYLEMRGRRYVLTALGRQAMRAPVPTDGDLLATWYDLQHTVDDADKAAVFLAAAYELGRRGYTLSSENVWVKKPTAGGSESGD